MKRCLLLIILLPLCCMGQRKDTVLKYFDAQLEFTSKEKAVFYGVAVKRDDGWFLFALYPDTTPLLKVNFKDRGLKIKHGPYVTYFPKNKIAYNGFYENNRKNGVWQSWYENGNLKDSGYFRDNMMTGQWKRWHENGKPASESIFAASIAAEEMQRYRLTGMSPET